MIDPVPRLDLATLRSRAAGGDPQAISERLAAAVAHKGLRVGAQLERGQLNVRVEGDAPPPERIAVTLLMREVASWPGGAIGIVAIEGWQSDTLLWQRQCEPAVPGVELLPAIRQPQVEVQRPRDWPWDPLQLGLVALLALWSFFGCLKPGYDGPFAILHYPDLAIHETGHLIFMILFGAGSFMHILGGSLTQILFPGVFVGYFFLSGQRFSAAIALFWTGQNFIDVSVYIRDASARALPLTTPNADAHDWWNLLGQLGWLAYDQQIANFAWGAGVAVICASLVLGVLTSRMPAQRDTL